MIDALWVACGALLWLTLAWYPQELNRPRGLGAWTLWSAWGAISALASREPLMALGPWWRDATGVLVFLLAFSWWGRPHRRLWLAALWTGGVLSGALACYRGADAATLVLVAAALGSALATRPSGAAENRGWLSAAWAATVALGVVAAGILATGGARALPDSFAARDVLRLLSLQPDLAAGTGPGLFERALHAAGGGGPGQAGEWALGLVETGLVGVLLMAAALAYALPWRAFFGDGRMEWEKRAAAGACWALLLASFRLPILREPLLVALWFTALACAAPGADEEEVRPVRISRLTGLAGAVVCLASAVPWLVLSKAAEPGASPALVERAARLAPRDYRLALAVAEARVSGAPPRWGEAVYWIDRAIAAAPSAAGPRRRRAEILAAAEPHAP